MTIPTNTFGYYVLILGIDLEYLSQITSIPLASLIKYTYTGLRDATPNEVITIARALGMSTEDFEEKYSAKIDKNKTLTKEQLNEIRKTLNDNNTNSK